MGFIDLLFLEDLARPAPLNERQKKFIRRAYANINHPEFLEHVCGLSDKRCNYWPNKQYQIQLKKMIGQYLDTLDAEHCSVIA
jgi:hypothetical protein